MTEQPAPYEAVVQIAQNYYPPEARAETRSRARASAKETLDLVLIWRDMKAEIPHGAVGIIEREYAADMMISASTLRRKIASVRNWEAWQLEELMNAGVAWEHFQIAIDLAETAKKTPMQLLGEAVSLGNAHGDTMTVEEMTAHALGERAPRPETFSAIGWISRLAELPQRLNWDSERAEKLRGLLEQIKELMR